MFITLALIGFPLGLLGLVALPALGAIYYLRSRFRRVPVSSLMLWLDQSRAREGGRRFERVRMPLIFFLELAAVALLIIAAIQPLIPAGLSQRELWVILDDSFSMLAGEPTPRRQAIDEVMNELRQSRRLTCRLVRAGQRPQLLGDPVRSVAQAKRQLENWGCQSPSSDLDAAIALAREIAGHSIHLMVLTDRSPERNLDRGDTRWLAFGTAPDNLAIVNATRKWTLDQQRCLVEVKNFSDHQVKTQLNVSGADGTILSVQSLELSPGQCRPVVLHLADYTKPVTVSLQEDALQLDNRVNLLLEKPQPVSVLLDVGDDALRVLLQSALDATGLATTARTAERTQLYITDNPLSAKLRQDHWSLIIHHPQEPSSYTGPFVLDKTHPLSDGLPTEGLIWSASDQLSLPGRPILMAGSFTLMSVMTDLHRQSQLHLQFDIGRSNLTESVFFPVLIWNVLSWRNETLPGIRRPNLRVGMEAQVNLPTPLDLMQTTTYTLHRPNDSEFPLKLDRGAQHVSFAVDRPGIYTVDSEQVEDAEQITYHIAANMLAPAESDLRQTVKGRWGDLLNAGMLQQDYRDLTGLCLVLAICLLAVHATILGRPGLTGRVQGGAGS